MSDSMPVVFSMQRLQSKPPPPPVIELATSDVLLVDDDGPLLRMMDRVLRGAGYKTFAAPSPAFAMQLLRTTQFKMIILDVSMPTQTGIQLAEDIRKGVHGVHNAQAPMIFVTADDSEQTYEGTFDVSALRCIIKPFNPDLLRRHVDAMLKS